MSGGGDGKGERVINQVGRKVEAKSEVVPIVVAKPTPATEPERLEVFEGKEGVGLEVFESEPPEIIEGPASWLMKQKAGMAVASGRAAEWWAAEAKKMSKGREGGDNLVDRGSRGENEGNGEKGAGNQGGWSDSRGAGGSGGLDGPGDANKSNGTSKKIIQVVILVVVGAGAVALGLIYQQKEQARAAAWEMADGQLTMIQTTIAETVGHVAAERITRSEGQGKLAEAGLNLAYIEQNLDPKLLPLQQTELQQRVTTLTNEVAAAEEKISGRETLADLTPFYNLKIAQADFVIDRAALINGQAWFINDAQKLAISLDLANKSMSKVALNQAAESGLLTAHNQTHYFQKEGGRLVGYQLKSDGENGQDVTLEWPSNLEGKARALTAGANNWYFWQVEPQQVYRQKIDAETAVDKTARGWWTADATRAVEFDFGKISDTTIDNSLWLAQDDGQVFKMTNGAPTKWQIKDLDEALAGSLRIDTDYDDDNGELLILAAAQARVVIVDKRTGVVKRDLRSESFRGGRDIVVGARGGAFYVVGEAEVFRVGLVAEVGVGGVEAAGKTGTDTGEAELGN